MTRTCVDCGASIEDRPRKCYLCMACVKIRQRANDNRYQAKPASLERKRINARRYRLRDRPKVYPCGACGEPRTLPKRYCDACRQAFRQMSWTLFNNKVTKRDRERRNERRKVAA